MDKRQAIRETKALWKTILGGKYKNKEAALRAPKFAHIGSYYCGCPLCEYTVRSTGILCEDCPLWTQLGHSCFRPYDHDLQPKEFAAEVMKLKVNGK